MNKPAAVFFTGMDSFDAGQLAALFEDVNRRSGNHWTLAADLDAASVLVIDVDTLYGHMTWLRSQNSGQTIVALTTGASAGADYVLHRPVSTDTMRRLLHDLAAASDAARAAGKATPAGLPPAAPAVPPVPPPAPRPVAPPRPETVATPPQQTTAVAPVPPSTPSPSTPPPPPATPANAPQASAPATTAPTTRKLIDALLSGDIAAGPHQLELPGLPPLALDVTQKVFLCGGGIKGFLPHTKAILDGHAWQPLSAAEFGNLRKTIGGTQPLGRLVWLAALGASGGEIAGGAPGTRYRLSKWPQIEREFPKHFRIATTMMKGFHEAEAIAQQSGVSLAEVNDFIAASLVSGHAEIEPTAPPQDAAAAAPKSLLERLRGAR